MNNYIYDNLVQSLLTAFKCYNISKRFTMSQVFFVGDTPATGQIGGFKVGGANRCHTCIREEPCTKVDVHVHV